MIIAESSAVPSVFMPVDDAIADAALSVQDLGSRIVALSGRLAAATCRWLLLVAEFDARDGARHIGAVSTARWLEYACGIAHRTAVEQVRIARSLRGWPRLAEEMSAGRLSYSHVRAISRIATGAGEGDPATPELVEDLIMTARHGTVAQLEVMVRGLRSIDDAETLPGEQADRERVTRSWTTQSQWRLSARLDPERGAQVDAALAAVADAEGLSRADALVRLAQIGFAALADGDRPRALRGDEQAAIVVHVTAADVPRPGPADEGRPRSRERGAQVRPFGHLENGPGLPAEVIERLACAGRVRLVVRDGDTPHSDVLDLGRSRRLATPRQCRALKVRDGETCSYPGCPRKTGLEAHHVRHWLHGGPTDMDNLLLLCKAHHLAHHDGEFVIVALGRGRFRFLRDGRELPSTVHADTLIRDPWERVEETYRDVTADAARPSWDGCRMPRDYAINAAAQHLKVLQRSA